MSLRLYDTLSRSIREFNPPKGRAVRLYACGPTVYDFSHIGNFRSFVFVDLLRRYLQFAGYDVNYVTNFTDVDDRIIKRCREENVSLTELTGRYREVFLQDAQALGILPATRYPAATEHVGEMQDLIEVLVDKGHAYATEDGSVFFKISSFRDYGALSRIKVNQLAPTERVMSDNYDKASIRDFALWKGWKKEDGDIFWDSPWGKGRPGWHIECSAMSMKYLGEEFDIHCGGTDLIFPHHENEIAQSISATGKKFVNHWAHCEHLLVDGAKMSKSLGNYYTVRDLLEKGFSPMAIRYFLISTHYRQKVNLTLDHLEASTRSVDRLHDFRRRLEIRAQDASVDETKKTADVIDEFSRAMDDDLNISGGMGSVFNWVRDVHRRLDEGDVSPHDASTYLGILRRLDSVLGVIFAEEVQLSVEEQTLIREREEARRRKDWKRADEIRDYFLQKGLHLEERRALAGSRRV
ncbi:MAG: cysteine--tRNA ligase, partial [Fidelibacterota bacterium]